MLTMPKEFRTSRRIGGSLFNIRIVRAYGGRFGGSCFVLSATDMSGESLRTVIPEEEAGISVLAPTAGSEFQDAMRGICNSLVVSEADGQVLVHDGQLEALKREQARVSAEREAEALEAQAAKEAEAKANARAGGVAAQSDNGGGAEAESKDDVSPSSQVTGAEPGVADGRDSVQGSAAHCTAVPVADMVRTVSFSPDVAVLDSSQSMRLAPPDTSVPTPVARRTVLRGAEDLAPRAGVVGTAVTTPAAAAEPTPMLSPLRTVSSGRNLHSLLVRDSDIVMSYSPVAAGNTDDGGPQSAEPPALRITPSSLASPTFSFSHGTSPAQAAASGSMTAPARSKQSKTGARSPASRRRRGTPKARGGSRTPSGTRRRGRGTPPPLVRQSSNRPPQPDRLSDKGRAIANRRRQEYTAALKIQSQGRRRLAMKRVQSMRDRRSGAATRIQAAQRAKAAKRRVDRIRAGEEDPFAAVRDDRFRSSQAHEHDRLAVGRRDGADPYARVSGAGRAHAASRRKEYDEARRAATRIQSVARGRRDRERVAKIREARQHGAGDGGEAPSTPVRTTNRRHKAGLGSISSAGYNGPDPPLSVASSLRSSYAGSVHSQSSSSRRFRGDHPDFGPGSSDEEEEFTRNVARLVYAPHSSTGSAPSQ